MQDRKAPQKPLQARGAGCAKNRVGGNAKERKGKAELLSGSQAPCKPQAAFYRQHCRLSRERGRAKPRRPRGLPCHRTSPISHSNRGMLRGRGWAGMAGRTALLLGLLLLLLSHQPGHAGEAFPVWGG